jgi:transketolase
MLLYSYLYLAGYDLDLEDLKNFRQLHSKTPGHPELGETPGVETTTGPLGQGFANAVGMAVTEEMLAKRFNTEEHQIVDHYTYTILGDGCMMEGVTAEAASLAGHLGLGKLIAIYDNNEISIEGDTDLTFTESVNDRFKAYGWQVIEDVDGHDLESIREALEEAKQMPNKPTLIDAKTEIAYGAPEKENSAEAHGAPLGEDEIIGLKENLGLPVNEKFFVPNEVKSYFSDRRRELSKKKEEWKEEFKEWVESNPELKEKWDKGQNLELPDYLEELVEHVELSTPRATRKASGPTLRALADQIPYLVGGSADLAPSNKTYLDDYKDVQQDSFEGRNFRFGVREHAMGAVANGISLHGGLRPFTATFLVFSDYMRPAIRMAALMNQPIIYVFTHDSIYIGEDGPTHQPVEQLESLRLMPNLKVIRPADEEETKIAWVEALKNKEGPTALVLTRQNLPHLEKDHSIKKAHKGGYVVKEAPDADIVLMGSGSEVSLAVEVAELLKEEEDKKVKVVSIPDREKFMKQDKGYRTEVLGSKDRFHVVLEAGVGSGWHQLIGENSYVVSVERFGVSAPGEEVAEYLGFKAEKIAEDILEQM